MWPSSAPASVSSIWRKKIKKGDHNERLRYLTAEGRSQSAQGEGQAHGVSDQGPKKEAVVSFYDLLVALGIIFAILYSSVLAYILFDVWRWNEEIKKRAKCEAERKRERGQ